MARIAKVHVNVFWAFVISDMDVQTWKVSEKIYKGHYIFSNLCQLLKNCNESIQLYTGTTDYDTVFLRNVTTARDIATTLTISESKSSGSFITSMPHFILYLTVTSVAIFIILCSMCVGTYFYKHCLTQPVSRIKDVELSNSKEGYLDVDIHQQGNQGRDLDYLEPVNSYKTDYNEIPDHCLEETFQ